MYENCGSIEDANKVFNSMRVRNVITWTALIVGYAKNGQSKDSLQFYDEMIASGIEPDFINFIGLLFACSHAGLVDHAQKYFKSMVKIYQIKPGPGHYACMIDLLGRSGKMHEAEDLTSKMVVEPDATVWKALLSACRVHGKIELAERAATALFELEPQDAVPYVLLSNMYSSTGKWEEAARIRRLMKLRGVSKEPGCSWIEITEDFDEIPVQSRGFGILDVGYHSEEEAWAAGGSGILLKTTNRGKTWSRDKAAGSIAANLYSVKFINDKHRDLC